MTAAEITGAMLLTVSENFVQLMEDLAYETRKKSGKDTAKKKGKQESGAAWNALVGEDSNNLSKEFLGALDRDNSLTEKEMYEAVPGGPSRWAKTACGPQLCDAQQKDRCRGWV